MLCYAVNVNNAQTLYLLFVDDNPEIAPMCYRCLACYGVSSLIRLASPEAHDLVLKGLVDTETFPSTNVSI